VIKAYLFSEGGTGLFFSYLDQSKGNCDRNEDYYPYTVGGRGADELKRNLFETAMTGKDAACAYGFVI
jgi:hypothetical protein